MGGGGGGRGKFVYFNSRLHIQQVEAVIHILYHGTLVTLVPPSCYPPLKTPNYFLNESSKITEKSIFLLTHFDDCF